MEQNELEKWIELLNERDRLLREQESDLADRQEELQSQKEELTAAVEELIRKNAYLTDTLEKLKTRNQELDQILYRASHDLKTPISSIFGLINILKSQGLQPSQEAPLFHLEDKALQMQRMLTSLTGLSKAVFDPIKTRLVSIKAVIREAVNLLADKGSHMTIEGDPNISCHTDEALLRIALRELLENAITFSEAPSETGVRTNMNNQFVLISVYGNGEKIGGDIEPHIFEMFYRGSERSRGAGLGLYIVKKVMERINGEILFERRNDENIFTIKLPQSSDIVF